MLPVDRAMDERRRRRFLHEAQALSALNHPHIVMIFELESAVDIDFIVMEYVRGTTLNALIPAHGFQLRDSRSVEIDRLLSDSPERTKREFQRLGASFTVSPVVGEAVRPFLREVGTTDFSAILAGSRADFTPTVESGPQSTPEIGGRHAFHGLPQAPAWVWIR